MTFVRGQWSGLFTIDDEFVPKYSYTGIANAFKGGWLDGRPCGFMVDAENKSCRYIANFDITDYSRLSFCIIYPIQ